MHRNNDGVDFLPMRLAAVLAVTLILLASAAACVAEMAGESSKATARACVRRVAAVAAVEYVEGCPDSCAGAELDLSVPRGIREIVFGAAASESPASLAGLCVIRYADGSGETYVAGLPLGSGGPAGRGGPIALGPGRYTIGIRTEMVDGRPMALIFAEAA